MEDNTMKNYYGICEWSMPVSGPLAIRLAGTAGFDGMQLGEAGGRSLNFPLNHPEIQQIYNETARHYEIRLHSLNLGALLAEGTIDFPVNTPQGDAARASIRNGIRACRALDIRTLVITVSPKTEDAYSNALSHLEYACRLAEISQVEIAVESALPLPLIQVLLDRLKGRVKVCMDILNPLRFGTGDPIEQIQAFGTETISHFHMKDSLRSLFTPGQRGCVLLGTGDAGYIQTAETIKKIGFQGWMITENYYYLPPMNMNDDFMKLILKDFETLTSTFES